MSFVRVVPPAKPDALTTELHEFLASPAVRVGHYTAMDAGLANRVEDAVLARSADSLVEVRRRERATPPEVLAFQLM